MWPDQAHQGRLDFAILTGIAVAFAAFSLLLHKAKPLVRFLVAFFSIAYVTKEIPIEGNISLATVRKLGIFSKASALTCLLLLAALQALLGSFAGVLFWKLPTLTNFLFAVGWGLFWFAPLVVRLLQFLAIKCGVANSVGRALSEEPVWQQISQFFDAEHRKRWLEMSNTEDAASVARHQEGEGDAAEPVSTLSQDGRGSGADSGRSSSTSAATQQEGIAVGEAGLVDAAPPRPSESHTAPVVPSSQQDEADGNYREDDPARARTPGGAMVNAIVTSTAATLARAGDSNAQQLMLGPLVTSAAHLGAGEEGTQASTLKVLSHDEGDGVVPAASTSALENNLESITVLQPKYEFTAAVLNVALLLCLALLYTAILMRLRKFAHNFFTAFGCAAVATAAVGEIVIYWRYQNLPFFEFDQSSAEVLKAARGGASMQEMVEQPHSAATTTAVVANTTAISTQAQQTSLPDEGGHLIAGGGSAHHQQQELNLLTAFFPKDLWLPFVFLRNAPQRRALQETVAAFWDTETDPATWPQSWIARLEASVLACYHVPGNRRHMLLSSGIAYVLLGLVFSILFFLSYKLHVKQDIADEENVVRKKRDQLLQAQELVLACEDPDFSREEWQEFQRWRNLRQAVLASTSSSDEVDATSRANHDRYYNNQHFLRQPANTVLPGHHGRRAALHRGDFYAESDLNLDGAFDDEFLEHHHHHHEHDVRFVLPSAIHNRGRREGATRCTDDVVVRRAENSTGRTTRLPAASRTQVPTRPLPASTTSRVPTRSAGCVTSSGQEEHQEVGEHAPMHRAGWADSSRPTRTRDSQSKTRTRAPSSRRHEGGRGQNHV
ncbi:unnamed protein product [Amoebophrya sp. A120]|nr:unnamed protein product [Amoebophrya sp. A120]|eukprot:GSA120T00017116001.1